MQYLLVKKIQLIKFYGSPSVCGPVPMTPFCHHFSQLRILSPCCHHVVTILSQSTMRQRKLYSDYKLNWAIGEYDNGTKKVIAVTESMNVWLKSAESSFQMIIDACEVAAPALYQLVRNLVFLLKIAFLAFSYLSIGLKSRFQSQTGWFIMSHTVVTRKKFDFCGKM